MSARSLCLALMLGAAVPSIAFAQDFERVAPKLPASPPAPDLPALPATEAASTDPTVLMPELKGIVFVGDPAAVLTGGAAPSARMVSANGLPLLNSSTFMAKVSPHVGQPLTRAALDSLIAMVREEYRIAGRPFVEVTAPPQNIQSGVIQIIVTEYRVGEVSVTGNRHFSEDLILRTADIDSGDVLTLRMLRTALDDLNQNPFLTVNAVLKPGRELGRTNLHLEASDRRPWRVYAGYDNQGVSSLGRDQWNVGVNWGNAFGTGQILSYQYTRSFTGRYASHSLSDVIPLGSGRKLLIFGAYATQLPTIAEGFDSEGHSGQISARYVNTLPGRSWLEHSLQLGLDFKQTDNNLEFAGFRLIDTAAEIVQTPLVYDATLTDRFGRTTLSNQLIYSPGGVTKRNSDEAIRDLVPGSGATYIYDRLAVTRTTSLPGKMIWVARATLQTASRNLPYSEQLGGGGIGSMRGYDPDTALGSEGLLISQELRLPALTAKNSPVPQQIQLGLFYDYAKLTQPTPLPDVQSRVELASIGVNAHYAIGTAFDLQIEVGSQLKPAPGADRKATQAAVVLTFGF